MPHQLVTRFQQRLTCGLHVAKALGGTSACRLAVAAALAGGCAPDRVVVPPRDSTAPHVHVLSPTPSAADLDGDGFVDLSVTWADSAGRVDFAHATLRSLDGLAPPAPDTADLLRHWRIERLDSAGLVAHETVDYLLRRGVTRLVLEVPDTAGNVRRDTLPVQLPHYVTLSRTIETGLPWWPPAYRLAICDDGLLYAPIRSRLAIINPDSQSLVAVIEPGTNPDTAPFEMWQPLCIPGDPVLYIADFRLARFDRPTRQWLRVVRTTFASSSVASSRTDPDLIYEGESKAGIVGIISRSGATRTSGLLDMDPNNQTNINAIVAAPGDNPLYVAYGEFGGVWAVDPVRDSVLARINLATPGDTTYLGQSLGMAPSLDGTKVYVAVTDGSPRGLAEIDVATSRISHRLALAGGRPITLAVSPDGRWAFVTTQDVRANVPSDNVLIDLTTWQPLEFVSRPRPAGDIRWDQGVVFHPNGKLLFVAHNQNVDAYLLRQ